MYEVQGTLTCPPTPPHPTIAIFKNVRFTGTVFGPQAKTSKGQKGIPQNLVGVTQLPRHNTRDRGHLWVRMHPCWVWLPHLVGFFGQAAKTSSTFCRYTITSSVAGLNVGTKDANWVLTVLGSKPPDCSDIWCAPDTPLQGLRYQCELGTDPGFLHLQEPPSCWSRQSPFDSQSLLSAGHECPHSNLWTTEKATNGTNTNSPPTHTGATSWAELVLGGRKVRVGPECWCGNKLENHNIYIYIYVYLFIYIYIFVYIYINKYLYVHIFFSPYYIINIAESLLVSHEYRKLTTHNWKIHEHTMIATTMEI